MRNFKLSIVFVLVSSVFYGQDAVYSLDFISNWSATTHPIDYPSAAHWSSLVGATHNSNVSFWKIGELASEGVEKVAEDGETTIIFQEINQAISNGNAYEIILLPLGFGDFFEFETINVDIDFPFISLMTMLAPSPDWLAEVNNFKLTDDFGNWKNSVTIDVHATDSGTDSGPTYIFADTDTDPAENIYSLENTAPFSAQKIATFVFNLSQVLSVSTNELENSISVYPNPSNGTIFIKNLGNIVLEYAEVYAANGKRLKVYKNFINQKNIELNSLSSGLYFLKLSSDKGSITKKFVVQ